MKTVLFIFLFGTAVFTILPVFARGESVVELKDDEIRILRKNLDNLRAKHKNDVDKLCETVKQLEVKNKRLQEKLDEANAELQELGYYLRNVTNELETAKTEIGDKKSEVAEQISTITRQKKTIIAIVLCVGVSVIIIVLALLRPAKRLSTVNVEAEPRCPRCGWKYAPGEIVCKNCKTRF